MCFCCCYFVSISVYQRVTISKTLARGHLPICYKLISFSLFSRKLRVKNGTDFTMSLTCALDFHDAIISLIMQICFDQTGVFGNHKNIEVSYHFDAKILLRNLMIGARYSWLQVTTPKIKKKNITKQVPSSRLFTKSRLHEKIKILGSVNRTRNRQKHRALIT